MPKPGQRDLAKEEHWRNTIMKWRESELSKSQFCQTEGIKLNAFCGWERTIRVRDQEIATAQRRERYRKATAKRRARKRSESANEAKSIVAPKFVQVRVAPDSQVESIMASGAIEIIRPDGLVIKVPPDLDLQKLLAVLKALSSHNNNVFHQ